MVRALALLGAVGCYNPHVPADVPCGPGDTCPTGQRCNAGLCGDDEVELGFGMPEHLAELASSSDDFGTTLDASGTVVVINSDRVGNQKLWTAARGAPDVAFGLVTPVLGTDMAGGQEYDPELSQDGLEMLYHSTIDFDGLRRVTRPALDASWSRPEVLPEGRDRDGPSLALDDLRMFVSVATDGGIEEYARGSRTEAWTRVRAHPALAITRWPAISADGLEIFVVVLRDDQPSRLLHATRASIDVEFGPPRRVALPGTDNADVTDPELSPDGKSLYVSINLGSDFDIYRATR